MAGKMLYKIKLICKFLGFNFHTNATIANQQSCDPSHAVMHADKIILPATATAFDAAMEEERMMQLDADCSSVSGQYHGGKVRP